MIMIKENCFNCKYIPIHLVSLSHNISIAIRFHFSWDCIEWVIEYIVQFLSFGFFFFCSYFIKMYYQLTTNFSWLLHRNYKIKKFDLNSFDRLYNDTLKKKYAHNSNVLLKTNNTTLAMKTTKASKRITNKLVLKKNREQTVKIPYKNFIKTQLNCINSYFTILI